MAEGPVTPIPIDADNDAEVASGETNPTILEKGASQRKEAAPFDLPERIGHYKVVREIGAGGMGHVLKCLDTTLNRFVALKLLRPALARNAAFIERFRREAHAVAQVRHPNIVQIYAIDHADDRDFFTMEYVDGEGLDRILARRKKLPEREAVQICLEVCRGLHEAHEAGILHRDIKPGNVLVNNSGRAQLADFGLAKFEFQQTLRTSIEAADAGVRSLDPSATDPGRVMGTPFYMAPELIRGRQADARTDVYAMGVMLYELLAGRAPFRDRSVEKIFDMHLNELPRSIAELNPEVSLETANIVYRALEKDAGNRFPDAGTMADALQEALDRERRARELQSQAKLSAEMASAFGAIRMSGGGSGAAKHITRLILAVFGLALVYIVMESLQVPSVGPIPGSALGDRAFRAGTRVRFAGIVNEVTATEDRYRIALLSPIGEHTVRVRKADWEGWIGSERAAEDDWWALQGVVAQGVDGTPEVVPDPEMIWRIEALRFYRLATDSDQPELITHQRVTDPESDMIGRRAGVRGTIVGREDTGEAGEVRLLLVRPATDPLVLQVLISAAARSGSHQLTRCRVGESVLARGRLTELEVPPSAGLLTPAWQVHVEDARDFYREERLGREDGR